MPWLAPFSDQRSAAALPAAYLIGVWRSLELLGRTYAKAEIVDGATLRIERIDSSSLLKLSAWNFPKKRGRPNDQRASRR